MRPAQLTLKLVAACLQYPGPGFADLLAEVDGLLPDLSDSARPYLEEFVALAAAVAPMELESRYTQAFDFQKEHALHLTFQEVGETPQRALDLITLQDLILGAGFLLPEGELADFIPLLLEFVAELPPGAADENLPVRLAGVLTKIRTALAAAEPLYAPLLAAALAVLPEPGDTITPDGGKLAEEDSALPFPMPHGL